MHKTVSPRSVDSGRGFLRLWALGRVGSILQELAETGLSLRVQTRLENLKKADVQNDEPVFSMCKCSQWRQGALFLPP
jgi:hypothetical protein